MRGNQLPVSATRWQHGYQIYFETYLLKIHKIDFKNSTINKARKHMHSFGIPKIVYFYVCLTTFKKNQSNFTS